MKKIDQVINSIKIEYLEKELKKAHDRANDLERQLKLATRKNNNIYHLCKAVYGEETEYEDVFLNVMLRKIMRIIEKEER